MDLTNHLDAARAALGRGDLAAAAQAAARATDAQPASLDAWLLRAQVALTAQRGTDALGAIERALALGANPVEAAYYRGCALSAQLDYAAALMELERVLAAMPGHVPTRLQRARCLAELGRRDEAGLEALALARRAPPVSRDALPLALRCARELATAGERVAPLPLPEPRPGDDTRLVSFVICSIDAAKLAKARASIAAQFDGTPWELIHVPDAKSLCEGYNRGIERARGDVVVLCHDDIELIATDFRRRLLGHLAHHDVVGVAGCTDLGGPAWFWSGPPHIHYWLTHYDAQRRYLVGLCGARGPVVERALALDGVFIAARREVFSTLRFDADVLDGWHGYDLDFSYRAHRAGLRVAVALDLLLIHDSGGHFDETYRKYAERLCRKFPELLRQPEAEPPLFHGDSVDTLDEVRAVYDRLGDWCARLDALERR